MSKTRLAMVCDGCGVRGDDYDPTHTIRCRECGLDFCEQCREGHAEQEAELAVIEAPMAAIASVFHARTGFEATLAVLRELRGER